MGASESLFPMLQVTIPQVVATFAYRPYSATAALARLKERYGRSR